MTPDEIQKQRLTRYHELVDRDFAVGITDEEREELNRLGEQIDQFYNPFYEKIMTDLNKALESAPKTIPISDCKPGYLYRISARNFNLGVYTGQGFIGIREKLGNRYLDTEYHWDTGAPFGTVHPLEELCQVPEGIPLAERGPLVDFVTGREVAKIEDGVSLMYRFVDTGETNQNIDAGWSTNRPLLEWLKEKQKESRKLGRYTDADIGTSVLVDSEHLGYQLKTKAPGRKFVGVIKEVKGGDETYGFPIGIELNEAEINAIDPKILRDRWSWLFIVYEHQVTEVPK